MDKIPEHHAFDCDARVDILLDDVVIQQRDRAALVRFDGDEPFVFNRCSTVRIGVLDTPNRLQRVFSLRSSPGLIRSAMISFLTIL